MGIKLKDFFDNVEELGIGAVFGLSPMLFINWWVLLTMPLCALLWRLGGVTGGNKLFRRVGIPLTLCGGVFLATFDWLSLLPLLAMWAPLTMGYGIPDARTGDEGSVLGRFFFHVTDQNEMLADLLTRLTIGVLIGLTLLPLFWVDVSSSAAMVTSLILGFVAATLLL